MENNDMLHHLHNMIIEGERDMHDNFWYISNGDHVQPKHDANKSAIS
jgi:hypothetical protein